MMSAAKVPTPESLGISRSDSKNPAKTCRGITGNGRHCRRALAVGAMGIRKGGNGDGPEFFCHQHKDQARVGQVPGGRRRRKEEDDVIRERSSIETLVQRLGISQSVVGEKKKKKKTETNGTGGKWENAGEESQTSLPGRRKENDSVKQKMKKKKKPGFWASLCCGGSAQETDDYVEIIRHRKRLDAQTRPSSQSTPTGKTAAANRPKPTHQTSSNTATNNLLALLPPHLSPETTASLLSELVKPISPADEEGYIYIYWLTTTTPDESTKRNLLAPPSDKKNSSRRISDVLSTDHSEGGITRPGTLMLKIGRASNVARRMKEWERQCGFKLNLLRWYPYASSSSSSSSSPSPSPSASPPPQSGDGHKKVPYVKKVERLIHLELVGQQVRRQCTACGKEHREWFEVEATREGVRAVDGVVRRWVAWAEGRGETDG